MKKLVIITFLIVSLAAGIFIYELKKEEITYRRNINLEQAIKEIPSYHNLLTSLDKRGFEFWSFKKYWKASKDSLPEKLIVIRHDIHTNDVKYAYSSFLIEKNILNQNCATYYVMIDDPLEKREKNYTSKHKAYLDLITFLNEKNVEVQPHISPIDMLTTAKEYEWENYSLSKLDEVFSANYQIVKSDSGIVFNPTGTDIFQISQLNDDLETLLKKYNKKWLTKTGLDVKSYAAHGSHSKENYVLENSLLLDQIDLLKRDIYNFDTYNSKIFKELVYLSDNSFPQWIDNPALIKDGRYELLMHPGVWNETYKTKIKIKRIIKTILRIN